MQALQIADWIPVEDYLTGEPLSEVRHEYIGGTVYAMAGASEDHNVVAGNLFAAVHSHLRGGRCRAFIHDMKVRLEVADDDVFYYPDVMVACDPRDTDPYFKRHPKVLVEVLSPETERTDRREKFLSYTRLESLEEYVLIAQSQIEVTVFRRANQWRPEVLRQPEARLELPSLEFSFALRELYEGVSFRASAGPEPCT